eukprot:m.701203 g.701203  ORF g.701203 m.701203 type:complete len:613 (-) comp22911_c0_seq2:1057-2895(-)
MPLKSKKCSDILGQPPVVFVLCLFVGCASALANNPNEVYAINDDSYHESLGIRNVAERNVTILHFDFVTETNAAVLEEQKVTHFNLFPSEIAQTIRNQAGVDSYRISLTQGHWDHSHWGSPVLASAPGAELHAVLNGSSSAAWARLTQALSGLLCTSLSFMRAEDNAVRPQLQEFYAESGRSPPLERSHMREKWIGVLAREHVCTENLTPFFKLLPCKNEAGLAALLHPESVFDVEYHAMHTQVSVQCATEQKEVESAKGDDACEQHRLRVHQSVTLVVQRQAHLAHSFAPGTLGAVLKHPGATAEIEGCAVAESAVVYRMPRQDGRGIRSHALLHTSNADVVADLTNRTNIRHVLQVSVTGSPASNTDGGDRGGADAMENNVVPVHVQRHAVAQGRDQGRISTRLWNTGSEPLVIHTLQILPSFLRVYSHTLKVSEATVDSHRTQTTSHNFTRTACQRKETATRVPHQAQALTRAALWESAYTPARDQQRAGAWEHVVCIPPATSVVLEFAFSAGFLQLSEYPPDPHRGAAVPALVLTARTLENEDVRSGTEKNMSLRSDNVLSLRSTHLSILLPTPDFSMPFNVIALTSTALALTMGTFIQYSTRLLVED